MLAARLLAQWEPSDLGAKLLADWDADYAPGLSVTGSIVTSCTDRKSGYVLGQSVSGSKPMLGNTINGHAAIAGDGVDDRLALEPVPPALLVAPFEIWLLVNQPALPADTIARGLFYIGATGSNGRVAISRSVVSGANRLVATIGEGGTFKGLTSPADFSGIGVVRLEVGTTTYRLSLNDADAVSTAAGVGGPSLLNTRIAALAQNTTAPGSSFSIHQFNRILITQPLASDEAARLFANLKSRGGIA